MRNAPTITGEYEGFSIGFVGPEWHPSGGGSYIYRAWWCRISTGKERIGNILEDSKEQAVECARECVDYILGIGKYEQWTLAPVKEQTREDYPLRLPPWRESRFKQ